MEVGFVGGLVTRKWISSSSSSTISARRLYMSSDVQTSSVTANTLRVDLGPLKVSPIGVGTWAWGDQLYWGSGGDEKLQKEAFEQSLESGINLFDTAEVYGLGESERRCGRFLRSYKRMKDENSDAIIATKFAPLIPFRYNSNAVIEACKRSAERIGVDTIDLYQLHWPGYFFDKTYWDGIAKCYDMGLIKAVGVSNYGPSRLIEAHKSLVKERGVPLVTNQVLYSLLYRKPEEQLLELCESLDIKILAYSPFAQGVLTGKYDNVEIPEGSRGKNQRKMQSQTVDLRRVLREIADARGRTMAQVSLNWLLAKGVIPIPGAKNREQAAENAGALGWTLTPEEVVILDDASKAVGDVMAAGFNIAS